METLEHLKTRVDSFDSVIIYGAGPIAKAFLRVLKTSEIWQKISCVAVTSMEGNPDVVLGLPVYPVDRLPAIAKKSLFLIGTVDLYFEDICSFLHGYGYHEIEDCTFESLSWSLLRERYLENIFQQEGRPYQKADSLPHQDAAASPPSRDTITVYIVKTPFDRVLKSPVKPEFADYLTPIQVGCALTSERVAAIHDDDGDNISSKNKSFCELTATYWIWKHAMSDWVGLCHYRRHFDLTKEDLARLVASDFSVVLTTPILNFPSCSAMYSRDHVFEDYMLMLRVLKSMYPDYYETALHTFEGQYYYAYNMLIARREVFDAYCSWLFPILFELDHLIDRTGRSVYQKRVIGFLSERLTSLFFVHNQDKYKILHVHKHFYR